MADNTGTAANSLVTAIQALVSEAMEKSKGANTSQQGTAQVQQQTAEATGQQTTPTVTPGTADLTQVSQTNSGLQKTTNMKTGEYVSPYQQEQQQLQQQLQGEQLPEMSQATRNYMNAMFEKQTAKFSYNVEDDPLVAKAKENLQQSIMDMASKRGFAYGGLSDIVTQQMSKLAPQFESIAYNRNADYMNRQIALSNTMMKWESIQFDRKKNAIELIRTKLDFINRLDTREFNIFKTMMSQRNIQRKIHMESLRISYQKQHNDVTNALARVESLGYVDNQASLVLGTPVGTQAKWVQKAAMEHQNRLDKMYKENEYAIQKQNLDAQMDRELFALQNKLDEASKMKYQALEYNYKKELQAMEFNFEKEKASIAAAAAAAAAARSRSSGGGGGGSYGGGGSGSGLSNAQLNSKYTTEAKRFMAKFGNKGSYGQDAAKYLDTLSRAGVAPEVLMRMKDEFGIPNLSTGKAAPLISLDWATGEVKVSGKKVTTKKKKK